MWLHLNTTLIYIFKKQDSRSVLNAVSYQYLFTTLLCKSLCENKRKIMRRLGGRIVRVPLKQSVVQEHVPGRLLSLWSASSLKSTGCPSNPLPMFKGNGGPLPGLPLWCALRHQSYHCSQVSLALLDRGRRKNERVNWLVTTSCPRHGYGFNRITAFSAHWCAFSQTNEKTQTIL